MGRGLRTDLGDTAIFTSGKEEKSVKETGREGAGGGEETHENVIFWKLGEAHISRRKGPDSMLLRNRVRCGLRIEPWIWHDMGNGVDLASYRQR